MSGIDISIIYVNWNCSAEMTGSINSVREQCIDRTYEIIVVDNDSSEDLSLLETDYITLIRSPKNGGFGFGCNLGAKEARGKYLLFLNPDTIARNNVPGILFDFMERHPEAGACGSMLMDEDGAVNYNAGRRYLSLVNDFLEHSTLCFRYPKVPFIGRPYYGDWDHRSTRAVNTLCGACMMFRPEVFRRLGGFDEDFFMYCEEVDLCRRTHKAGYEVYYVHQAELMHAGRKSTMQYFGDMNRFHMQYIRSTEIFFRKNYGRLYARIWRWSLGALYMVQYLRHRRERKIEMEVARWGFSNDQHHHTHL